MNKIAALLSKLSALSNTAKIALCVGSVAVVGATGATVNYIAEEQKEQEAIQEVMSTIETSLEENFSLKDSTILIEYGSPIYKDIEEYVELSDEVVKDITFTLEVENEKGKEYPAVGEYRGKIEYKEKSKEITISVKDTTAPTFKEFNETIELYVGDDHTEEGLKTYFIAEDLSGTPEIIFEGVYDFTKVGTYEIKVNATDKYGNAISNNFNLIMKEKPKSTSTGINYGGMTPGYDGDGDGKVSRPTLPDVSQTVPLDPEICVYGKPHPDEIGNSGLVFYGDDAYYAWRDEYIQSDEYFATDGFTAYYIEHDECGNLIRDQHIWTVVWW